VWKMPPDTAGKIAYQGGALLELLFTNRVGLKDVGGGSFLGQSEYEMGEFSVLGDVRRGGSAKLLLWASGGPALNYSGHW